MKTVGIIGGLGPKTTANFYLEVVFACSKISKKRPQLVISNVAIPLRIEKEIITQAKNEKKILPFLINSAQELEKAGVDFIVIPCNTVHLFIDEVRKSVDVPVLSIIEETTLFLKEKQIKEIGLLSTGSTIKNKLFNGKLARDDIKVKFLNQLNQARVDKIINRLVNNKQQRSDKKELMEIIDQFEDNGINSIVLACTDLQILKPKHKRVKIFDTMQILAKSTVKEMLS